MDGRVSVICDCDYDGWRYAYPSYLVIDQSPLIGSPATQSRRMDKRSVIRQWYLSNARHSVTNPLNKLAFPLNRNLM